ncbi:MAG TPA: hypothetical protein PK055_02940 [Gammaproteobacteria bacterium]|nr:hypothetical protein [Xanthomonadales bacterium]MCB1593301.1 hypothetical protein [Xanthomonadales bacterium]HOP22973.1 hypothetical protein [Gammaproteobacteria bacterium]HPI95362.1 hypothetical protein [Gammaproteobacteria bacterium]HPQ86596.1 hypothetical protein [Gammaproteobacteria bacterium]
MNRHLKIAFFITPLLALLGYFLTGVIHSDKKNKPGTYQLVRIGECKPLSSSCVFRYGEFELKLISKELKETVQLAIVSNTDISALSIALSIDNQSFEQFKVFTTGGKKYWQLKIDTYKNLRNYNQVRLATQAGESSYFIETEIIF